MISDIQLSSAVFNGVPCETSQSQALRVIIRFRPLRHNGKQDAERRHMDPDAIDRVVRKYACALKLDWGYSAHSMGRHSSRRRSKTVCSSKTCRKPPGIRDPSSTKLYDRRSYNSEKAAS